MENQSIDLIAETVLTENTIARKRMLPWWIKTFSWIFLVIGCFAPLILMARMFGFTAELALYGLESSDTLSTMGIAVITLFILKGIVAYGLLFEKQWAINLALIDSIIGIFTCIIVMLLPAFGGNLRLELVALIPYLVKMLKIKVAWENQQVISV